MIQRSHPTAPSGALLLLRTRAPLRAGGLTPLFLPGGAGEALVDLDVAGAGGVDDVVRDLRARRLAVPPGDGGRPVADELLVEVALRAARLPLGRRPEPGGVGGEHLIGEGQRAVLVEAKLQLRVRDD